MDTMGNGKKTLEKVLNEYSDTPISKLPAEMIERGKTRTEAILKKTGDLPMNIINTITFKDELRDAFPIHNDELDISFLLELLYYFPIDKTYIAAGSYDQYLYDLEKTVIENYDMGNYQVSFFYAHLIFMSYVYYCVEKAYDIEPDRMKDVFYPINTYNGRSDKPDLEHHNSIYDYSKIPEKEIFKVFRIMSMDDATIKEFSRYISSRDDYAHATGKGNISEQEFRQNIRTVIGNMNTLRNLFLPTLKSLYISFVLDHLDADYDVVIDNFNDFVYDNSLSILDLDYLCHLGVRKLQETKEKLKENYQATRNIHCAFIEYCYENDGISLPDGYPSLRNVKYLFYRYKGCANEYVENELGINAYRCVKDGEEFPVYECPECGEEQLVHDAENHRFHCFACDSNFTNDDLVFCERCGNLMKKKDEAPICQNCIECQMEE